MIPVDQTVMHNPDKGEIGNCFAAFLASILHLPIESIPHFVGDTEDEDDNAWIVALNAWLRPHNLCFLTISPDSEWLARIGVHGMYHELSGISPRDSNNYHATVGLDGKLIHDPHPSKAGLAGNETIGIFAVLEPWNKAGINRQEDVNELI